MTLTKAVEAEVWKQIVYKGVSYPYEISSHGNVRNSAGKLLRFGNSCDYPAVCLYDNGAKKTVKVHRLVALHFLTGEQKPTINHIDGVKKNNHATNLEWQTHAENIQHAVDTGLNISRVGEKNCHAKFKNSEVPKILSKYNKDRMTIQQIAKEYGVGWNTIQRIVTGESYKAANALYVSEEK